MKSELKSASETKSDQFSYSMTYLNMKMKPSPMQVTPGQIMILISDIISDEIFEVEHSESS